jgi:hypothetical protein
VGAVTRPKAPNVWAFPKGGQKPEEPQVAAPNGAELLDQIVNHIKRYSILPGVAYLMLALWVIATHAVEVFDCFPYIAVVSAVRRSGKSRLFEVLNTVVRRPWFGTAPSPAAIYRMLEGAPTLLLDEVEILSPKNKNKSENTQVLLAVLNAGHRKGATIPRCEPPKMEIRHFSTYGPKAFACIGRLPDTLMDRSIIVNIKRRMKAQKVERFRERKAKEQGKPIHDGADRFVKDETTNIERAYQAALETDLEFLNDRDADIWTPLFVMCSVTSPERIKELENCARELSKVKGDADVEDSYLLTLLRDIRKIWPREPDEKNEEKGKEKEQCETTVLLDRLKLLQESPWLEDELTARKLAYMLKPFEVRPRGIRVDQRTPKGYVFKELKDAFDRYLEEPCEESDADPSQAQ